MQITPLLAKARRFAQVANAAARNYAADQQVVYVVEAENWSIRHDGVCITSRLPVAARISTTHFGIRHSIVHYGSINTFFHHSRGLKLPHASNAIVATCFHVAPDDSRTALFREAIGRVAAWHTSCCLTRDKLIQLGVPADRIVMIPLGVDSSVFQPVSAEERQLMRRELGIPADHHVIGSFQKDGSGWQEGLEPKWIKGPDVFCDVLAQIASRRKLFVMLTGPARGYVKRRLTEMGIPFAHRYEDSPNQLTRYYALLDLYLVASREEGGPKQILEAMASGVPVVSTAVGMAPDIIRDGENGYLAAIGDVDALARQTLSVIDTLPQQRGLIEEGLVTAKAHDWQLIAERYAQQLYRPLL